MCNTPCRMDHMRCALQNSSAPALPYVFSGESKVCLFQCRHLGFCLKVAGRALPVFGTMRVIVLTMCHFFFLQYLVYSSFCFGRSYSAPPPPPPRPLSLCLSVCLSSSSSSSSFFLSFFLVWLLAFKCLLGFGLVPFRSWW